MKKTISFLFCLCIVNAFVINNIEAKTISGGAIQNFYVGTYTEAGSEGIYRCGLDTGTGKLSDLKLAAKSDNPSYIALTEDNKYLLAVNETIDLKGNKMGYIESFSISNDGNTLIPVNKVSSGGAHPCYVSVNDEGYVLAANYTGGSVALFKLGDKGKLSPAADVQQHHGGGPNKQRQEGPHVHSAFFEPGTDRIFVADLGTDAVSVYHIDKNKTQLVAAQNPEIKLNPGSGPRHLAFHPKKKILYVVSELSNSVSAISLNQDGSYTTIETVPAIPVDYKKSNTCADIHISKDGRFLYVSNRGLNTIAIFSVNQESGKLALIAQEPTKGENPRNFTLSPDENYLLVANQTTQNIVSYKRDKKTGKLTYVDQIKAHVPVCLLFQKW
jgi:6-phosphogluconolactonase